MLRVCGITIRRIAAAAMAGAAEIQSLLTQEVQRTDNQPTAAKIRSGRGVLTARATRKKYHHPLERI